MLAGYGQPPDDSLRTATLCAVEGHPGPELQFTWGETGRSHHQHGADVVVVIDVFSFCTCVDVAVGRSAAVVPWGAGERFAAEWAARHQAVLAASERSVLARLSGTLSKRQPRQRSTVIRSSAGRSRAASRRASFTSAGLALMSSWLSRLIAANRSPVIRHPDRFFAAF